MQTIIEFKKSDINFNRAKALWKIAECVRKEDKFNNKESMHYIHYNAETERLEATDGRRALTVAFDGKAHGIEYSCFFEFRNGFLSMVEFNGHFPAVKRVIPRLGNMSARGDRTEGYVSSFDVKDLELSDKYALIDCEVCALLGSVGVKVNGLYIKDLKDILTEFDFITWQENEEGEAQGGPVMFFSEDMGLVFVVMPMTGNNWRKAYGKISAELADRSEKAS